MTGWIFKAAPGKIEFVLYLIYIRKNEKSDNNKCTFLFVKFEQIEGRRNGRGGGACASVGTLGYSYYGVESSVRREYSLSAPPTPPIYYYYYCRFCCKFVTFQDILNLLINLFHMN